MVQEFDEEVKRVEKEAPFPESGSSGGGFKALLMPLLSIVASVLIVYLFLMPSVASKTTLDTSIQGINTQLSEIKTSVTALSTLSSQVAQINNNFNTLTSQVDSLRNAQGSYATADKVNSIQSSLDSIRNSIPNTSSFLTQSALDQRLSSITTQLSSIQTELDKLKQQETSKPTISSFSPTSGGSGTEVKIYGTNFSGITDVTFGGETASDYNVDSTTQITATVGEGADGVVRVITDDYTATSSSAFDYSGTSSGTTSGSVVASYFNSPMIFTKPIGEQTKSFGVKIVNNYSDKDLVYVNLTVKMTVANISTFEDIEPPTLTSTNGYFNWEYERGTGNTVIFNSDAYLYVARDGGEFSDTQKLRLVGDETTTGTYTVSVTSITINSKTLQ
jgi:hypothetical protein